MQGITFASGNVTYKTVGNTTTFYSGGKVVSTYRTKSMPNGFVETETCYGDLCHYEVMTSMMAKNYIYTIKNQLEVICALGQSFEKQKKQEQERKRIIQANKSIIVKQVTVTTQREDTYKMKKRSYEEIIYSSTDLCDLFKVVYKLRVEYGVCYEDAQKLMTFGIDNRHYKPSDLLLPSEKQAIKFQKNRESTSEKLKNVTFPKI